MRRIIVAVAVLAVLLNSQVAFSQSVNASVSGTVQDASGALIPGVSITATNDGTGVVTSVISNEAGAYNFVSLLPGVYTVSSQLPGFQTKTFTNVQLGNAAQVRLNFELMVGGIDTAVEVTVAADALLAASTQSVGEIISQQRIQDLPTVANNVMDLYRLIPGVYMEENGVRGSFAGMQGFGTTNITRDGVDASGGARWTANALTATHMSPDLIGEVKIVVAPVDAEMGRGNAQLQFLTRSGTNEFRGSAVWNARNSRLDANTWNNNRQVDPRTRAWSPTAPDWHNVHNIVGSFGGPIVRNKTFFFALWDQSMVNQRSTPNAQVLTPCARNGIFRYFDDWNNGNYLEPTQAAGGTPTIAVVDGTGNPIPPANFPGGTPHNGTLRYASVFGPLANTPARPDCSDARLLAGSSPWDVNRRALDSTGMIAKFLDVMPLPNNYEMGDGLNTAGHRWVRNERDGVESLFNVDAAGLGRPNQLARKQINTKLDHHFNQSHKLSGSYTYEYSQGTANYEAWPTGYRGSRFRRPQLMSLNFVSTLSPSVVNEGRFGWRRTGGNSFPAFYDPDNGPDVQAFFPKYNGYPVFVGPGTGQINFAGSQISGGGTAQYNDVTQQVTWADSLSWTKGVHTIKFGGEIRRSFSLGADAGANPSATPRATGGDAPLAAIPAGAISTANIAGLAGTTAAGNNQRMRNLLSFLAGSLGSVSQFYYMQDPTRLDDFEDLLTFPQRIRETHRNEFSSFIKDDWKVTTNLTLNLGLRWDWYGSIYDQSGMMPLPTEGPGAAFGISGRSIDSWMSPGQRAAPTVFEYVGKNSPNPDKSYFPNDWNNFGPAIGFAYQVPWFGAGKTTVRGGYQVTYSGLPSFNTLTQSQVTPGSTLGATYTGNSSQPYLDLTMLPSLVPVPKIITPMQQIPNSDRTQTIYVPQINLVTPYIQNVTLSVARSITSNVTLDVRYLGTLARKNWNMGHAINQPNFLTNGLKEAFDAVRAGGESQLLDSIFNGINIAGTGFGPVGTVVNGVRQTGALHMRQDTRFRAGVANGDYQALANALNTLNYSLTAPGNAALPPVPAGENGAVLRYNGYPENFIKTNPQFSNVSLIANSNHNNYHSLEASLSVRPIHGVTMQNSYTWSKNLGLYSADGRNHHNHNPFNWRNEYSVLNDSRSHDFRSNGTFTLPVGPSRAFLGNSTGTAARILEDWSMSWVINLTSGDPINIAARSGLYNYVADMPGTADLVGPLERKGTVQFTGSDAAAGSYFSGLQPVRDPQCANVTTLQGLQTACTLNAVANASGQIVLQNSIPGIRGNLNLYTFEGPGRWRFDANISKRVRLDETRSLRFRIDATNVFNHPEPSLAALITNINDNNFGLFTGANAKNQLRRQFQAQLRFDF